MCIILISLAITKIGYSEVTNQDTYKHSISVPLILDSRISNNHEIVTRMSQMCHKMALSGCDTVIIIDFTKNSLQKRLAVYQVNGHNTPKLLFLSEVATGSGCKSRHYSNEFGSKCSSIGIFHTAEPWFGHNGRSLRVRGLQRGINDNAYDRLILIHGAPYVRPGHVGHSFGCFAVPTNKIGQLLDILRNGAILFVEG